MKDKEIRRILIAYLGTHPNELCAKEIRIYQEKSIGSAICDLMAVTDKLTGYEIKSDNDDYHRLDRQIKAYDRFFDENYIVVSERHARSAAEHVPPHWGILRIRDDSITLERQAKRNKSVSRRAQLSVLWKLELKNILIMNRMPLYPLKTKDFIVGAISEQVDPDLLGRQIASELMQRDYSVFGADDYTVRSEAAESLPETEIVDTLSEQDLSDYTLDQWIELYRRAKQIRVVKEEAIKTLPKERKQHAIPYTDIEVSLGAPWIDKRIVSDFILEVFKPRYIGFVVEHEQVTGNWLIANKNAAASSMPARLASKYGLERYNALCILEATLNLREIKLYDDKTKFNEKDTIIAKSLDKVRPGGIVAFVTSSGTLDKQNPAARRFIAKRAELVGAIRLPNNAFQKNAGTSVVTDILFLQKRDRPIEVEPEWVHLGKTDDGHTINQYFIDNPQMILGTLTTESTQYGRQETTVAPIEGEDLADQLRDALSNIHTDIVISDEELDPEEDDIETIPADPSVRNYSLRLC